LARKWRQAHSSDVASMNGTFRPCSTLFQIRGSRVRFLKQWNFLCSAWDYEATANVFNFSRPIDFLSLIFHSGRTYHLQKNQSRGSWCFRFAPPETHFGKINEVRPLELGQWTMWLSHAARPRRSCMHVAPTVSKVSDANVWGVFSYILLWHA